MEGILSAVLGLVVRAGLAAVGVGSGLAVATDFARLIAADGGAAAGLEAALAGMAAEDLPVAGRLVITDFFDGTDFIGSKRRGCRAQEDTHGREC